jgi:hypothetical protein
MIRRSSLLFSSLQRNKIVGLVMYITFKVLDLHEKESRTVTLLVRSYSSEMGRSPAYNFEVRGLGTKLGLHGE